MHGEILSTKEAAVRLKISVDHVRKLLESGELKGKKLGRDWVVLSVDYERKRRPKGYRNSATE